MAAKVDGWEPEDTDLDFPALDTRKVYESHRKAPKPRPASGGKQKLPRDLWRNVSLVVVAIMLFTVGRCSGLDAATDAITEANKATTEAQGLATQAAESRDHWMEEADEASSTANALKIELADALELAQTYKSFAEEASSTIATLKQQKATPAPKASTPSAVQAAYTGSYDTSGVEQWRSLVDEYFPDENVDAALSVMRKESGGNPNSVNSSSGASGLFQQMPRYWPARLAAAEVVFWDLPDSIFEPRANIAVSAVLSNGGRDWNHWSAKP